MILRMLNVTTKEPNFTELSVNSWPKEETLLEEMVLVDSVFMVMVNLKMKILLSSTPKEDSYQWPMLD